LEDDFSFNDGSKHTFNPEDLVKEAKAREDKLRATLEAAKQEELRIAKQEELEKQRLAEAQRKRELEAQAQKQRDLEIAKQRELEAQKLAEAQKIKDTLARQKAEAESKERDRQLALAAEEEKKKSQEAERQRLKAEADAKEREKQLMLAAEQEKLKALAAQQAMAKAKVEEAQRLKEIELAKLQVAEEAKLNKGSSIEAKEKQFVIEKADWDKIKDSKNADDFYAYLNKYPNGFISQQALFTLENLAKAKITAQKDKNGIQQIAGLGRFRVGDTWVIATIDNWINKETSRATKTVTKIENGLVFISGDDGDEIRTQDGALVKSVAATFDPPRIDLPGDELIIGKRWKGRSIQKNGTFSRWRDDEFKIVGFEEITIPAGVFKAFKIESTGMFEFGTFVTRTFWVEPNWGVLLKTDYTTRPRRGNGGTRETYVLISRVRGEI
jgi:hypothetical protein